ncbi:thioesterase II family protein [Streptomyces fragilis]|uniref:Alpha/beta fold hydrolase n=1 Tax=Streptomyces fragilis TaxID=67301 RepID=A0ABV2YHH9_9ACTN|nr:alpha/beta fold hydrolase [Streptomyces fragilis]
MAADPRDLWLRRFHPAHATAPEVVCFPHAGGSAAYWHRLSSVLAPEAGVSAVQYPGRHDRHREPPAADLHTLADHVAEVLGRADRPRVLLGHSMGASLAYEVAVRLAARGHGEPSALIVSGRRAPSCAAPGQDRLSDDAALVAKVRSLGGTAAEVLRDPDMLELMLPVLRGDYRALAAYTPSGGPPLRCPVLVLAGDRDGEASVEEVRAWRHRTSGEFRLRVFAGGHFFLTEHLDAVARLVRGTLPGTVPPAPAGGAPAGRSSGQGQQPGQLRT